MSKWQMPKCFVWALPQCLRSPTSCDEGESFAYPCTTANRTEGLNDDPALTDRGIDSETAPDEASTIHECIAQALDDGVPLIWGETYAWGDSDSTLALLD